MRPDGATCSCEGHEYHRHVRVYAQVVRAEYESGPLFSGLSRVGFPEVDLPQLVDAGNCWRGQALTSRSADAVRHRGQLAFGLVFCPCFRVAAKLGQVLGEPP